MKQYKLALNGKTFCREMSILQAILEKRLNWESDRGRDSREQGDAEEYRLREGCKWEDRIFWETIFGVDAEMKVSQIV